MFARSPRQTAIVEFVVVRWRFISSSQTYCYGMPFASRNGTVHLFHISCDLLFSSFCHYHSIRHTQTHSASLPAQVNLSTAEVIWWRTKWSNHLLFIINGRWTIWRNGDGSPKWPWAISLNLISKLKREMVGEKRDFLSAMMGHDYMKPNGCDVIHY